LFEAKNHNVWAPGYASIFERKGKGLLAVCVLWATKDVPHFGILM